MLRQQVSTGRNQRSPLQNLNQLLTLPGSLRQQISTRNQQQQPPQQQPNQLLTLPGFTEDDTAGTPGLPGGPRPPWWQSRGGIIGIAAVLLAILLGGILFFALNRPKQVVYQYARVTQGTLSQTISATGPIQSAAYNVIFQNTTGVIITEIDVKVGQHVVQGQKLAALDKTILQDTVNQDQTAVNNAQANLNAALNSAGATAGQNTANVANAQTSVSNAQSSKSAQQSLNDANVASAQRTLDNDQQLLSKAQTLASDQKTAAAATRNQAILSCQTEATATASTAAGATPPTTNPNVGRFLSDCERVANTTFNQTVATANQSVTTAQTKVRADQAALSVAEQNANLATTNAQNTLNTSQSGVNVAQANAGVSSASSNSAVVSAEGNLATAKANLAQAQHNLAMATLFAPHAGTITFINGSVGGAPGTPTSGTVTTTSGGGSQNTFLQIQDLAALQVAANVNESDTSNVKIGEPATFTVNAYGDHVFNGTVSAISPSGVTTSNVVTYPVYIDVDPNSAKGYNLLPGMTGNVTITVVQRPNVLLIPVNAVNFARLASSGNTASGTPQIITRQAAVSAMSQARQMLAQLETQNPAIVADSPIAAYVIEPSSTQTGQFIAKPIVLGLTDGTVYEVLAGLNADETIVVGAGTGGGAGATGTPGAGGGGGGAGG